MNDLDPPVHNRNHAFHAIMVTTPYAPFFGLASIMLETLIYAEIVHLLPTSIPLI